jgi:hypothetical protein
VASCKHFAMSSKAKTSPFSTTGRCLNLPVDVYQPCIIRVRYSAEIWKVECISIYNTNLAPSFGGLPQQEFRKGQIPDFLS